jgi:hypothetical protein
MTPDPFTLLYDAIIKQLTDRSRGRYRVISWNTSTNPKPDVRSEADCPEWMLVPTNSNFVLGGRSCSTTFTKTFALSQVTASKVLGKGLFTQEWILLSALYDLQYDGLAGLTYNDREFVEDVRIDNTITGMTTPEAGRPMPGWGTAWTIAVAGSFPASDFEV